MCRCVGGKTHALSGTGKGKATEQKYSKPSKAAKSYDEKSDITMGSSSASGKDEKKQLAKNANWLRR